MGHMSYHGVLPVLDLFQATFNHIWLIKTIFYKLKNILIKRWEKVLELKLAFCYEMKFGLL